MVKKPAGTAFKLCPLCGRALPLHSQEQFCSNDGALLMTACPACRAPIVSPYAHYCPRCGQALTRSAVTQSARRTE